MHTKEDEFIILLVGEKNQTNFPLWGAGDFVIKFHCEYHRN